MDNQQHCNFISPSYYILNFARCIPASHVNKKASVMFFLVVGPMSLLYTCTTVTAFKHWPTRHRSRWPTIHLTQTKRYSEWILSTPEPSTLSGRTYTVCLKMERQICVVLLAYSQFESLSKDNFDWYFKVWQSTRTYPRTVFNQHLQHLHTWV